VLLSGLRDPDPNVRRRVLGVFERVGPLPELGDALRPALSDADWTVREAAVGAMAVVGGKRVEPALLEASLFDGDPRVRRAVHRALADVPDLDSAPFRAVEGHYRWKVRLRCAEALGKFLASIGPPAAELLGRLLDDSSEPVRRAALKSLRRAVDGELIVVLPPLVRRVYEFSDVEWRSRLDSLAPIHFVEDPVEVLHDALGRLVEREGLRARFDAICDGRIRMYEPSAPLPTTVDALLDVARRHGTGARREAVLLLSRLVGLWIENERAPFA
jgi:HEAT repeat protein